MTRYLINYATEGRFRVGCYIDGRTRDEALDAFYRRARYMGLAVDPTVLSIHEEPRR